MKLSEHKDLKKEILALPVKEKDKLLLRLVAKDKVLTEHLHFFCYWKMKATLVIGLLLLKMR